VIIYLAIALVGALLLAASFVLGEVFDFLHVDSFDGDVHPLSGKVIAVGMTAFGAVGMLTHAYGWGAFLSALTSLLAALLLGAAMWWVLVFVNRQVGSTDTSIGPLRGRTAEVTVKIPGDSVGEVVLPGVDGTRHLIARSSDGSAIPAGSVVRIVEAVGMSVVVERAGSTAVSVSTPVVKGD